MDAKSFVSSKLTGRNLVIGLVVLALLGGGIWYWFWGRSATSVTYMTQPIERGNIINKVAATGTVQAVTTVQVGSQASGTISAIYVDFNSIVHKGEVIAELDPASLQAQVQQAQANLDQATAGYHVALANLANARASLSAARSTVLNTKAGVSSAQGNLASLKAQSDDALSLLKKQKTLFSEGIIAERDVEVAQTSYKSALAKYQQAAAQVNQAKVGEQSAQDSGIAVAQAAIQQQQSQVQSTQAQIKQTEAALKLAKINLSHTTITSPIDGVVVARLVDVGQTVAASLSAPTLFSIANDLSKMQVMANIDEADIGSIDKASRVDFAVDAFPGETFNGTIRQLRLNAVTVSNVVTYNAIIDVENTNQKLKPGMTANITFVIAEKNNVIKIPNSAFRFSPQQTGGGSNSNRSGRRGSDANANSAGDSGANTNAANTADNSGGEREKISRGTSPVLPGQSRIVWTLDANKALVRHLIKIGISDGTASEMTSGDLQEGDLIVVGETATGATKSSTQSAPGFGGAPSGRGGR